MSTKLHTFKEIFTGDGIESAGETIKVNKIIIPIIQRDYAQGRESKDINRVRDRFLDSLYRAITEEKITLDFVYGDVDSEGTMTPLDGQQRLTTLFLLHWYAAKKENIDKEEYSFLNNFSYETRYSAREFCHELVAFDPSFADTLSEEIINQAWFPLEWKKDPTIKSMLVMINAIDQKFGSTGGIWKKLSEGAISFYFLPIKDMGLTDELYIKMNSRGKPLTQFEHFKAELERNLKAIVPDDAGNIGHMIDVKWTDMLWMYRGDNNITDDEFLRYFKFICDIICYKENGTPQGRSYDEFFLLNEYFGKETEHVREHIDTLKEYFDCWCDLGEGETPKSFLGKYIANDHTPGKIQYRGEIDIFADCLNDYAELSGKNRKFPLPKVVLLYAVITYLRHWSTISENEFRRRLRIIYNLIRNSNDEMSDSETRTGGNRIPPMLHQVDSIMINGFIDAGIARSFNAAQTDEEIEKYAWIDAHPEQAEKVYELEDHPLLNGQIGIIGLDNIDYGSRFFDLFRCDYDLIDCALMSIGNYGQGNERYKWRYQFGTKNTRVQSAWQELFHKSRNTGYENTKAILKDLLNSSEEISDDILRKIKDDFLRECEEKSLFDIRYYYVKYDGFRPGAYGKIGWGDYENAPYKLTVLQTDRYISPSAYQPFLYEVDHSDALSKEDYGEKIKHDEVYIICENDAYVVKKIDDDTELDRVAIDQNEEGIDTEDRIMKFRQYYESRTW